MAGSISEHMVARGEVADLVNAYALHVRSREAFRCSEFFTEDAVFETWRTPPGEAKPALANRLEGREAILAYITKASQGAVGVCPMIHNLLIEVNGREATSNCVMAAVTIPAGGEIFGEYQDAFRFDGRWRFSSRKYTILLERPAPGMR
jgi:hypothetical protein